MCSIWDEALREPAPAAAAADLHRQLPVQCASVTDDGSSCTGDRGSVFAV